MAERPQLSIISYRQGMYITIQGNRDSDRFFIIQKGSVQLSRNGGIVQQESGDTLRPGDFFGVVSTMAHKSELETAQAMTDITLVAVSKNQFEGLIQFNTPIAMKIIQQFSKRMRDLNNALTSMNLHSKLNSDDASTLFTIAEYSTKQKKYKLAAYAYKRYMQCYPEGPPAAKAAEELAKLSQYDKPNYKTVNSPLVRQYPLDSPVFLEGETSNELFIIQTGSVKITKITNNEEVILALLKPGDIFGEMAVLESKPRSASAITFENSTIMVIQKQDFEGMAATSPQIIARLTQLLAERIWFSYKQLENATIKDPVGRCFDYLLIQLEKSNLQIQSRASYVFNFGMQELTKMASIPEHETRTVVYQILQNPKISVTGDGKIFVSDISELAILSEYYKKAQNRTGVRK